MDEPSLDAKELLERVKSEHRSDRWAPLAPQDEIAKWREWPMRSEESLDYLHRNWVLPDHFDPASAGGGIRGSLVRAFARLTFRVLGPYLAQERELLARMVRISDALAKRCDSLSSEIARREIAEAENGADLAAWLDSELRRHPHDPGSENGPSGH
jgi:hypothetical protein